MEGEKLSESEMRELRERVSQVESRQSSGRRGRGINWIAVGVVTWLIGLVIALVGSIVCFVLRDAPYTGPLGLPWIVLMFGLIAIWFFIRVVAFMLGDRQEGMDGSGVVRCSRHEYHRAGPELQECSKCGQYRWKRPNGRIESYNEAGYVNGYKQG